MQVRRWQGAMPRDADSKPDLCAEVLGFGLYADVRCGAEDRQAPEWPCRYIAHPRWPTRAYKTTPFGKSCSS